MKATPLRLRVVGGLLGVLGAVTLAGVLVDLQLEPATDLLWSIGIAVLFVAAGAGLVLGKRWAWPIAVIDSLLVAGAGVLLVTWSDVSMSGALNAAAWLILVATALLIVLFSPASRRWLRGTRAASTHA